MRYTLTPFKLMFFLTGLLFNLGVYALNSQHIEEQADATIKQLYHTLHTMPNTSMGNRIDWISAYFKGIPYVLNPLGEGPKARYDQYPRYRVDAFDCDTYVNTVLALALANSLGSFQQSIKQIRYKNGHVAYLYRNHFTSIDWNRNNQNRGVLKDITTTIIDKNEQPVALIATAMIDKPSWYQHKTLKIIRLQKGTKAEKQKRLQELQKKGSKLEITESNIPYIPLTALFSKKNEPNTYLFSQIPNGAVIEIVRPNWNLKKEIGTALNVSHLGFGIWIRGQLFFREASSKEGKVVDVPLINYLKEALTSPTIKGINIQIVDKKLVNHPYKITQ